MRPVAIYLAAKQLFLSYFALKMDNFALIVRPTSTCKLHKLKKKIVAYKYCTVLSNLHNSYVKPRSLSRRSSGIGNSCHFTDFAQTWFNFLPDDITTKYM